MMFVLTNFSNEISRTFTSPEIVVAHVLCSHGHSPTPYLYRPVCTAGNANLAYIVGKSEKSSAKRKMFYVGWKIC